MAVRVNRTASPVAVPPGTPVTTPNDRRRTTLDPHHEKRIRVVGALMLPRYAAMSNRQLARTLQVDESTVRRVRAEYGLPSGGGAAAEPPKKNAAGKGVKKKP
jgi:hypothetical protein